MIEGQAQHHHPAPGDIAAVNHHFLDDATNTKDSHFGRVDDRSKSIDAICTQVGDGERTARDFVDLQAIAARFGSQTAQGGADLLHTELIRVADYRHD